MKKNLLFIIVIISIIYSTSCTKSKENKLVGVWEYQVLKNISSNKEQQLWTFDGTDKLTIDITNPDTILNYSGTYNVSSKFMGINGYYVNIKGIYSLWNGLYKIEKLKDNILVINRVKKNEDSENQQEGGEFLWKEFVRNK